MKKSSKINISKMATLQNVILFLGIIFVVPAVASAASTNFSWIPNPEPNVVGYKIHYGTKTGGPYPYFIDINGNVPDPNDGRIHGTVTGLTDGITYYFVCTGYDNLGNESSFSSEAVYPEDLTAVPVIKSIQIN